MSEIVPDFIDGDNYVVWCHEHLRDGHEYCAKVVTGEKAALDLLGRWANSFFGRNCEFRLFKLGPEVLIHEIGKPKRREIVVDKEREFKISKNPPGRKKN